MIMFVGVDAFSGVLLFVAIADHGSYDVFIDGHSMEANNKSLRNEFAASHCTPSVLHNLLYFVPMERVYAEHMR